jgi:hypothetical protein
LLLAGPRAARTFRAAEALVRCPALIGPYCRHGLLRCATPMDMPALVVAHADPRNSRAALHLMVTEGKYLLAATQALVDAFAAMQSGRRPQQQQAGGGPADFAGALRRAAGEDPGAMLLTTLHIAEHLGSQGCHYFSRSVAWTDSTLLAVALRGAGGEAGGAAGVSEEEASRAAERAAGLTLMQRAEMLEAALCHIKARARISCQGAVSFVCGCVLACVCVRACVRACAHGGQMLHL